MDAEADDLFPFEKDSVVDGEEEEKKRTREGDEEDDEEAEEALKMAEKSYLNEDGAGERTLQGRGEEEEETRRGGGEGRGANDEAEEHDYYYDDFSSSSEFFACGDDGVSVPSSVLLGSSRHSHEEKENDPSRGVHTLSLPSIRELFFSKYICHVPHMPVSSPHAVGHVKAHVHALSLSLQIDR